MKEHIMFDLNNTTDLEAELNKVQAEITQYDMAGWPEETTSRPSLRDVKAAEQKFLHRRLAYLLGGGWVSRGTVGPESTR